MEEQFTKVIAKFKADRDDDFTLWMLRFEALIESKEVSEVVLTNALEDVSYDALPSETKKKVVRARMLLVQSLGDKPLRTVLTERHNPYRMYQKLIERYATKNVATRVQLQTELHQMQYTPSTTMSEYIDRLETLFNRLAAMECEIAESMQVAILLASFGKTDESPYGPVVAALQTLSDESLTWETATSRLLQEYRTRNSPVIGHSEKAVKKEERALTTKAHIKCFKCGKMGHYKRECRSNYKRFDHSWKTHKFNKPSDEKALMARAAPTNEKETVVDSGASTHMFAHESVFIDSVKSAGRNVRLGDGRELVCTRTGTVCINSTTTDGTKHSIVLRNAMCVPGLEVNLLSCAQLADDGYMTVFKRNGCNIVQGGHVVASASRQTGIYVLNDCQIAERKEAAYVSSQEAPMSSVSLGGVKLWHQRYGHVHERCIQDMQRKNSVAGMSTSDKAESGKTCESCTKGKFARLTLKSRTKKAAQPGEVIYSDVCGPMRVASIGGARYFVTFTDEFSGFREVVPLRSKSGTQRAFVKFQKHFERQNRCQLKMLYTDHGGEFEALSEYLEEQGIRNEYAAPYTPQQNGVAERLNRTILDMARAMLDQAGLPPSFWAEAVVTAAHLRNVTGTQGKKFMTPLELLSGKKPDVRHLRVFGCEAWIHIPIRGKLDAKSRRGIVLRCLPRGVYRVWDMERRRTCEVRHVLINETVFPAQEWRARDSNRRALQNWYEELYNTESEALRDIESTSTTDTAGIDGKDDLENEVPEETEDLLPPVEEGEEQSQAPPSELPSSSTQPEDQVTYIPPPRRYPIRDRQEPQRLGYEHAKTVQNDKAESDTLPKTVRDAIQTNESRLWQKAITDEVNSLFEKKTWTPVYPPEGVKVLDSRFVFAKKRSPDGSIDRYKARIVVKGFQQINAGHVYAPVIDFTAVRFAVSVMMARGAVVHHLDVKGAFLNGRLHDEECIYINPPAGLDTKLQQGKALKLNKALYGLKTAPRIWNRTLHAALQKNGFTCLRSDECFYTYEVDGETVFILIYVDDILILARDDVVAAYVKKVIIPLFEMRDLGRLRQFLGVEFIDKEEGMFLSQRNYTRQVLARFGMEGCRPVATPLISGQNKTETSTVNHEFREVLGSLLYLSTRTRPDIATAVGLLARDGANPTHDSWIRAKRILRYLNGTQEYGLLFKRGLAVSNLDLKVYSDADWAGSLSDRKSTSGLVATLNGTAVMWQSKKQGSVALSSSEAEYIALGDAVREIQWLRSVMRELGILPEGPTRILEDNSGAIKWAESDKRAKHVDIKHHYVKDLVNKGEIGLQYCPTRFMVADIMTKAIPTERFLQLRRALGLRPAQ